MVDVVEDVEIAPADLDLLLVGHLSSPKSAAASCAACVCASAAYASRSIRSAASRGAVAGGVDRLLRHRDGVARQRREPGGQLERPLERLSLGDDLGDDARRAAPRRRRTARASRNSSFARAGPSSRVTRCSAAGAGEDPERDLGEAEDGGLVGDPEVERQRELERAAEAVAVDGRDASAAAARRAPRRRRPSRGSSGARPRASGPRTRRCRRRPRTRVPRRRATTAPLVRTAPTRAPSCSARSTSLEIAFSFSGRLSRRTRDLALAARLRRRSSQQLFQLARPPRRCGGRPRAAARGAAGARCPRR